MCSKKITGRIVDGIDVKYKRIQYVNFHFFKIKLFKYYIKKNKNYVLSTLLHFTFSVLHFTFSKFLFHFIMFNTNFFKGTSFLFIF